MILHLLDECDEFTPTHWFRCDAVYGSNQIRISPDVCVPGSDPVGLALRIDIGKYVTHKPKHRIAQTLLVHWNGKNYAAAMDGLDIELASEGNDGMADDITRSTFISVFTEEAQRLLDAIAP